VEERVFDYPLPCPPPSVPASGGFNYPNSNGFQFEAMALQVPSLKVSIIASDDLSITKIDVTDSTIILDVYSSSRPWLCRYCVYYR
jgi:hypothetical protein